MRVNRCIVQRLKPFFPTGVAPGGKQPHPPLVDYGHVGYDTYNNHRFRATRSGYVLREMIQPYLAPGLPTWA